MADTEAPPTTASEPLPPVDEAVVEDPPADEPLAEPPTESAPETAQADEVPGVVEEDPNAAALIETEQAIERAVAAPEAPAVIEPEPLPEQPAEEPAKPEGAVQHIKEAAADVKETSKSVKAAEVAAPSVVSKKSKVGRAKARVSRKVMPKVLGIGVPKEAVPLVTKLRQKKKNGEDIGKMVNMCMIALG
ncbi:hypothetical protein EK21DRAFT_89273 [Setomelanomma holmii]|uniref:Uncharacterized protein n=1 Tax=Setomelanomma holmii TaxID=210430 RepID=A0A9P4HAH0_9PLEO|nr:hypothetical protein EK21DRAFT_89273 [Setomelanomma holmii]